MVLIRKKEGDVITLLVRHVDDITFAGSCLKTIEELKRKLAERFETTDGDEVNFLLKDGNPPREKIE